MRARLSDLAQNRPLIAASLSSLVLRLAGMGMSFVLGVVLARYLGPAALGLYGVVIALALLLSVVAQAGLPTLATREIAVALSRQDRPTLRAVVARFATVVLGAAILLAVVQAGIALLFPGLIAGAVGEYVLGAALIPLFALTVLVSAEIRALGPLVKGQSLEIFVRPALTALWCLALIAASGSLNASGAIAANVIGSAAALALGVFWLFRLVPGAGPNMPAAPVNRQWTRSAIPLALVDGLKQIDASYAMLLLGILSADTEAGFFRVALSVIVVVAIPQSVLHVVLAPTLAKSSAELDRASLQRLLAISAGAMTATMAAVLVLLFLVGEPVITLLFGTAYDAAWLPLLLLTGAQLVNALFGVGWVLLSMGGGERELTRSYAVSLPLSIMAAILLIPRLGAVGAAGAALVGSVVQNVLVWRAIGTKYRLDCSLASLARSRVE